MDLSIVTNNFGPWHRRIFIAIFYVNVVGVWQNYGIVFLAANAKYRCIEPDFGQNATCHVSNGSTVLPCTKWEYEGPRTIISEWDLVCDREWLVSLSKSVYMAGWLFSVSIFGQLSDIFGRLPTSIVGFIITVASTFLAVLSPSYILYLVLRFFQAFGRMGFQIITYVLMLEVVGVKYRSTVGTALQVSWTLGSVMLCGIAFIIQDWIWLQLFMGLCFLMFAVSYFFGIIPECPRWLLMKGKHEELKKVLNKIAALNHIKLDVELTDALRKSAEMEKEKNRKEKTQTIFNLIKTAKLRKIIFIFYYLWAISSFMFYALLYNTNDLSGNLYLNFFLSAIMECVAYLALYLGTVYIGRRPTLAFFTLGCAGTCVARIALPQDIVWLEIFLWMLSLLLVSGAFGTLYVYTGELFPTVVRNVAIGSCSTSARIGSILAPFVKELGKATHEWVPTVIFGSSCLVGGLLVFLLPESKGRDMTDTLEEEENG